MNGHEKQLQDALQAILADQETLAAAYDKLDLRSNGGEVQTAVAYNEDGVVGDIAGVVLYMDDGSAFQISIVQTAHAEGDDDEPEATEAE